MTVWSFGAVVCFHAWWTSPSDEWGNEVIATIPEGMRPPRDVDYPMYRNNETALYGSCSILFQADGNVRIMTHGGIGHQGDYICASGCWVAA